MCIHDLESYRLRPYETKIIIWSKHDGDSCRRQRKGGSPFPVQSTAAYHYSGNVYAGSRQGALVFIRPDERRSALLGYHKWSLQESRILLLLCLFSIFSHLTFQIMRVCYSNITLFVLHVDDSITSKKVNTHFIFLFTNLQVA